MALLRWAVRLHKWIALVVGIQVLLWVTGGLVMTAIPIERVRGEHHAPPAVSAPLDVAHALSLPAAAYRAGFAPARAELRDTPRGVVWSLTPPKGEPVILDGITGAKLTVIDEAQARRLAGEGYRGQAAPARATYLSAAPQETGKTGPLWRVEFDDTERTALYLSPLTGEVVSRRSGLWRFYDFFWRLHIMDWWNGENFNHPLVIGAAFLTLTIVLSGFVLLWFRLARDLRFRRLNRRSA